MIVSRNTVRDFIDLAALTAHLGIEASVHTLEDFDDYYADLVRGEKASPLIQLIRQLAEPSPADLDEIDLSRYKGIKTPFDSWDHIVSVCEKVSVGLGDMLSQP